MEDIKEKIEALAKRIGPRLNWERDPFDSAQWDGKDIACKGQEASNIIHDIAHWAVASPSRRRFPDFGLGMGPDSGEDSECKMTSKFCDLEEEKASALGILWEKEMGLNWEGTAVYHSWNRDGGFFSDLKAAWKKVEHLK